MVGMDIPDKAVEAADKAVVDAMIKYGPDGHIDGYEMIARAALEAAALHMTERAYNAGHLDGMTGAPNNNPYRSQA